MQKTKTKLISLYVPENLLGNIDEFCIRKELTRTNYLLTLARTDLKKRNIIIEKPIIRNGNGWTNGTWQGKIEEMGI